MVNTEGITSLWQLCYNVSAASKDKFGTNIQHFVLCENDEEDDPQTIETTDELEGLWCIH